MGYQVAIMNEGQCYLVDPIENITLTRTDDITPSKLQFKILKDEVLNFKEGNLVSFKVNQTEIFKGFVFEKGLASENVISVVAYDQLRYLKNKDVYVFENKKATDIIQAIADDFGLKVGTLANTEYTIPIRIESDKTLADIIANVLYLSTIHGSNHTRFHFFDDCGSLTLKTHKDMELDIVIDGETLEDFTYQSSIDRDTYNVVKVVRETKGQDGVKLVKTGYVTDDERVKEWGKLQLLYKPSEKETNATEKAKRLLELKNRKTRTIRFKNVMGDIRVRGGSGIFVHMPMGEMMLKNYLEVESVTHIFSQQNHCMDLDMRYYE